jgi:hypothetical protein
VWANDNTSEIVKQVLSNKELWQTDLTQVDGLAAVVEKHLRSL